jgi:hypothetical protein
MKILAPDILELTRTLSPVTVGVAFAVGLLLWLYGAASHRFWLAAGLTLVAGLLGLVYSKDYDVASPLVAGLLMALAAGTLALSLVRLLLFLAGGLAGLAVAQAAQMGWNEVVCFLCGGLAGVVLSRVWIMGLSSFAGGAVMIYAALSLLDRLGKVQSVALAERNGPLLNWAVAGLTLTGVLIQVLLERRRKRIALQKATPLAEGEVPPKPPWWQWWKHIPIPQISWRKAA